MKAIKTTANIVSDFIEEIWNKNNFEKIDDFIHVDFIDHSLPDLLPANSTGLLSWIKETGKAFFHKTIIEDQVTEGNKSILKIKMELKHMGSWRGINPEGKEISTKGYRFFVVRDNKIIHHWALIDGNSIENQLKNVSHGCKVAE
ncbi:ester cyclase [Rubrolithibacter danxiaensis]|uniref:ester cyclase n=1 Tax=Rubrolithibacter danxiaensis TaxID=3390805 RepID=UPI003BF7CC7B